MLALFFVFLAASQSRRSDSDDTTLLPRYLEADRIYHEAEQNVAEEKEIQLNKAALEMFRTIAPGIEKFSDSLAFHTWFRIGVLEHYFENFPAAHYAYQRSIGIAERTSGIKDSLVFKPYLYLGIVLYTEMKFDSAITVYKKAEEIADKYGPTLEEIERLYNTLGAIYYETGNYRQAKNYLGKSISLLSPDNPSYRELLVNYKINMASIMTKLEEFDEAMQIYESLLPLNINRDIILHNSGVINLNLGSVEKALSNFRKVDPAKTNPVRLYNDIALGFYNLTLFDSALYYLQKALNLKNSAQRKNIPYGQTLKIKGDVLLAQGRVRQAIEHYQKAIIQFYTDFNDNDIYHDPIEYSGLFSYINLFNALTAKADAFVILYREDKKKETLKASLNAYKSAFRLADYVEKSYTSDEARLFLNKIKYLVHNRPIDISLSMYDLTGEKKYLEDAYLFDQHNKGSVISLSIQENELKRRAGINDEYSRQEFALRSAITSLSLRAARVQDSLVLSDINASIRDHEIQLGKVQEKMSHSKAIIKNVTRIPSVKDLQALLDRSTILLSYHLSENELLILGITKKDFVYRRVPINDSFFSMVETYALSLHNTQKSVENDQNAISAQLYSKLIEPVNELLVRKTRLIIIPDDELNYLPFETLAKTKGEYLIRRFSIQYQYAASLLTADRSEYKGKSVLAFAPFATTEYADTSITLRKLTYSKNEIEALSGELLVDSAASKQNFLIKSNKFPILHLATHAVVNDKHPLQSFIAFYPYDRKNDSMDYRLYAGEIYNLKLESARLVILSACETGAGELVRGEGLMSMTRAFAYAGCSDIVTSLWKAEDRTTAYITRQLHEYLNHNYPTDRALQKAKIDFLESKEIDPRLKSPSYWAHLIFIGNYEPEKRNRKFLWIIVILFVLAFFYVYRRNNTKKIRRTAIIGMVASIFSAL